MKILITGGAGYVGSHVVSLLRSQTVMVYDDFSTGHDKHLLGTPYVRGDIADSTALETCFADFRPDMVIHLAAIATIPSCMENPARTRSVNVDGTRNLLDAMRRHKITSMVFASSCAVYAAISSPRPFTESDKLQPPTIYGQTKLESEQLLAHYHKEHGISYAALRLFNVAGADPQGHIGEDHTPETHLLPLVIRAAFSGVPLQLYGNDYPTPDGTAVRDYVHVLDVAETMVRCAQSLAEKPEGFVMNVGSGTPTSVLQIAKAAEHATGKKVPYIISPRRAGDEPYLLGDISALKNRFPDMPKRSNLGSIVGSACAWHRQE